MWHPARHQHVDVQGPRVKEGVCTRPCGGARGEHVVDQQHAQAGNPAPAFRAHQDGIAQDFGAFARRRIPQRTGGMRPLQPVGQYRQAGAPSQIMRQDGRLVEPAVQQAAPVQRHRHKHVGPGQQRRAGAMHVHAKHRDQIAAVIVFQRQDQALGRLIIQQGRARLAPGRGRPDAAVAQARRTRLRGSGERYAAAPAERFGNKIQELEAAGAELARLAHRFAAARAERRQQQIEDPAADCLDSRHARQNSAIMSEIQIFDRRAVRLHRDRAAGLVGSVADILQEAAFRLLDRLDDTTHRFSRALDIGGRGVVAPMLRARHIDCVSMDLSPRMAALNGGLCVAGDEEVLPFAAESFDLVVANCSLHWVNDLPGALIQLRRVLRPDGLLLASLPALGTLGALRSALTGAEAAMRGGASPRISPFPDLRDCAALLQRAGFALPVADAEDITLLYADPLALLRDLRAAGETNALIQRARTAPPRALLPAALAALPETQGRTEIMLRLAFMTGWAPAESQPKPLKPGTGHVSLRDALS